MQLEGKIQHLYAHVPFCAAVCHYCAFYSESGRADAMGPYADAVCREIEMRAELLKPETIFFGGGTPSLLPIAHVSKILQKIREKIPLDALREWTFEANPATISAEKARLYREFGVNRISFGVQTFDENLLDAIGRVHSVPQILSSYEKIRAAGFENVNLDLMFGLPGQTLESWRDSLRRAIELQPEHISVYCLTLEEDTEFWAAFKKGLIVPNEETETAMYETAIELLESAGFRHYEIANFAKKGRECAHNIAYWTGKNYIGLGPSAFSTVENRRWQNVPDINRYIEAVQNGKSAVIFEEKLSPRTREAERAAFGLRMMDGVSAESVRRDEWQPRLRELIEAQLVCWRGDRLQLTQRGKRFADLVAETFVD
jgi:oxygen-independent coproporphyrinogen-3 oxidase